jgi:hypothetical protein
MVIEEARQISQSMKTFRIRFLRVTFINPNPFMPSFIVFLPRLKDCYLPIVACGLTLDCTMNLLPLLSIYLEDEAGTLPQYMVCDYRQGYRCADRNMFQDDALEEATRSEFDFSVKHWIAYSLGLISATGILEDRSCWCGAFDHFTTRSTSDYRDLPDNLSKICRSSPVNLDLPVVE